MTYDELKALIEQRGVHPEFGEPGENFGIEQNPRELATFLVRMQELGVASVLEIGTGYKGGLSRFLAQDMGWDVTTVDVQNYGHAFEGVHYIVGAGKVGFIHKFDLVFIDGDHSHDSVKTDYEVYGIYATKVIAFHDIAGLRSCEGVRNFWKKLTRTGYGATAQIVNPPYFKIIESKKPAGIGWIEL